MGHAYIIPGPPAPMPGTFVQIPTGVCSLPPAPLSCTLTRDCLQAAWFLCALAHSLSDRPEMLSTFVDFCQAFADAPTLADAAAFSAFTHASTDPLATYSFAHLCHDVPFLLHASLEASLPPHMRAFLLAAACAAACGAGHTASSNTTLAAQALDEVLLATCGHACTRCSHAVTFIVDLCTAPPAAGSEFSRQLLHHAHGRLLRGHFLAMAPQQLRMQREGVPVRFPTAVRSREMFAAQLTLPSADGSGEVATLPTDTGWFLKVHAHEEPRSGGGAAAATYSIFLNNEHAATQTVISASFIVGVLADSPEATQAAEVFAASSEPLCDSRTSKLAPELGIVHRSGCQLEFTGKGAAPPAVSMHVRVHKSLVQTLTGLTATSPGWAMFLIKTPE